MSGIGFSELLILFLIGLIVLGPEKLPRVANQLGTWLGQARRMTRVMKRQLEEELSLEQKPARPATVNKPEYVTPANETDDSYSPSHGPDEPGTGVGGEAIEESVSTESAEDRRDLDADVASAMPPSVQVKKEKVS